MYQIDLFIDFTWFLLKKSFENWQTIYLSPEMVGWWLGGQILTKYLLFVRTVHPPYLLTRRPEGLSAQLRSHRPWHSVTSAGRLSLAETGGAYGLDQSRPGTARAEQHLARLRITALVTPQWRPPGAPCPRLKDSPEAATVSSSSMCYIDPVCICPRTLVNHAGNSINYSTTVKYWWLWS